MKRSTRDEKRKGAGERSPAPFVVSLRYSLIPTLHQSYARRRTRVLLINPIMSDSSIAPMIDQMIGNALPPTSIVHHSGRPSAPASHMPRKAPTRPAAIEAKQPPSE